MDNDSKRRSEELKYYQQMPLDDKVSMAKWRIREFLAHHDAYVSISGKDSRVAAHLVHQIDPTVPLVFSNTGLEYESIQSFAKKMGAEIIRPEMRFDEVISKYGYPLISKEVAEAIYYARRIRSQSCNVERERENKRPQAERNNPMFPDGGVLQTRKRTVIPGNLGCTGRTEYSLATGEQSSQEECPEPG